jgi:hypothetical protein
MRSRSAWFLIGLAHWIRIRIQIKSLIRIRIVFETNADPQHCLNQTKNVLKNFRLQFYGKTCHEQKFDVGFYAKFCGI